jgi:hypothetical protein
MVKYSNLMKRLGKKGQNMTIGTIILIVLGIAVLVFLIFGFSSGWGNFWDKVTIFGGGKSNVDTIVQACEIACSQESIYDYCTVERTIKLGNNKKDKTSTCNMLNLIEGVNYAGCESIKCKTESIIITQDASGGEAK